MSKRVLLITRNFPPLIGGMERFVYNVYKQIQQEFICDVVGPKGSEKYLQGNEVEAQPVRSQSLFRFLVSSFIKSLFLAQKHNYSICIAGSGVTSFAANIIGRIFSIPVITFVYGLDLVVRNKIYQIFFVPMIKCSTKIIAISENTRHLAIEKGIVDNKISILYPGVDINILPSSQINFRKKYNLQSNKILLSVGRLIPRKGIVEFIKYSLPIILHSCPDVVLVIIGSEASNALNNDISVLDEIRSAILEFDFGENVLLLGRVDDQTLWSAYQDSDLFVFPLKDTPGDVEGFGMVAIEAALFGLPTVAFAVGGVVDAIEDGRSGYLIYPGQYQEFAQIIIRYLTTPGSTVTSGACMSHAKKYSWDSFGERLRGICKSIAK